MNDNQILRDLFRAHKDGTFNEVATNLIAEERRLNNTALADDLQRLLDDKEYAKKYMEEHK